MKAWLKKLGDVWKVGKIIVPILDAQGVDVKGVPLGTIERIAEGVVKDLKTGRKPKPAPKPTA